MPTSEKHVNFGKLICRGDWVENEEHSCVAATGRAGAFVNQENWAYCDASFASLELARLIAAAPEMYEALERLLGGFADQSDWRRAEAALRKARGEE